MFKAPLNESIVPNKNALSLHTNAVDDPLTGKYTWHHQSNDLQRDTVT